MENKRSTGSTYEEKAAQYLGKQGYRIITRNYRCRMGEIDLIAAKGSYLVFVEVKYRKNRGCGSPLEAVDLRKQHQISRVAAHYCMTHKISQSHPCRFDVVAILGEEITHIENAFYYCA